MSYQMLYFRRKWDTAPKVYPAAYHQTLYLSLMSSFLASRKISKCQLFYSLSSTTYRNFSYLYIYSPFPPDIQNSSYTKILLRSYYAFYFQCNFYMLMLEIFSFNKILKLKLIDANQFKKSTFKDITINFILQHKLDILFSNQDGCNLLA